MTTQEFRRKNFKFESDPVYDKGVWKNVRNELFTFHPSMLATTVVSSERKGGTGARWNDVPWSVCNKHENRAPKDDRSTRTHNDTYNTHAESRQPPAAESHRRSRTESITKLQPFFSCILG